jgi:membrane protease YdiL (CAAX protease family)
MEISMESKPYPGIKSAVLLCLLLWGIQLGVGIAFGVVQVMLDLENHSLINAIGFNVISLLTFGVVILIGYRKSRRNFNEVFMFNRVPPNVWAAVIVFMFGFVIISSELDNILEYFLPMPDFLQDMFAFMLGKEYLLISIISVGLMPAFTEEMLFRGIILGGFIQRYSPAKAALVSALLFGVAHLNPWQFMTAFICGLIFAWVCIQTKSILPCIYMHLFNNTQSVLVMRLSPDIVSIKGFNTAFDEHSFQPLWFDALGIVLAAMGVLLYIDSIREARRNAPRQD